MPGRVSSPLGRRLYTGVLTALLPGVFLRLAYRGLRAPAYWRRWSERLGHLPAQPAPDGIWVHAVSVGEVQAALPLIRALQARWPERALTVTTTTPTGSDTVRRTLGAQVTHGYTPYDLPGAVDRFLDTVRPRLIVILETELWPNLYHRARARGVPLVVVNARVSDRSLRGYQRLRALVRATLNDAEALLAQSGQDAERLVRLGADPDRVAVTGNLKFDLRLPDDVAERAQALRRQLGPARPVWVAGSTHEGEEAQVLEAFARVRQDRPDALLLLVPRHPERFDRAAALCRQAGLSVVRRSEGQGCVPDTAVFLGDTMGELPLFYGASDVAYVGGSLVPVGGHNVLEASALGVPVLFGPHMHNFREIGRQSLAAGAARQIRNADELAQAVLALLGDAAARRRLGNAGRQLVAAHRGAVARVVERLAPWLDGTAE